MRQTDVERPIARGIDGGSELLVVAEQARIDVAERDDARARECRDVDDAARLECWRA